MGRRCEERAIRNVARLDARHERFGARRATPARARSDDACVERVDTGRWRHRRRRDVPTAKEIVDSAGFARWLGSVKGKLVLAGMPQPSCRPDSDIRFWADSATYQHAVALRDSATADWSARFTAAHVSSRALPALLERAGVAGVLTNSWSRGWGVDKIQSARVQAVPSFDVSCEDYSLLARLASNGQHPRVHAVGRGDARVRPSRRCSTPSRAFRERRSPTST